MKNDDEKRNCERHRYAAEYMFSYFNQEHSYHTELLNCGAGGMCLKSNLFLIPGATVYLRFKKKCPNNSLTAPCEGFRSVALAQVKWCREVPGDGISHYAVGVKYVEPDY